MVFQRDSGIGRVELIHCDYVLAVQKVRRVSAYVSRQYPMLLTGQKRNFKTRASGVRVLQMAGESGG
jgi:hypothetical protein